MSAVVSVGPWHRYYYLQGSVNCGYLPNGSFSVPAVDVNTIVEYSFFSSDIFLRVAGWLLGCQSLSERYSR